MSKYDRFLKITNAINQVPEALIIDLSAFKPNIKTPAIFSEDSQILSGMITDRLNLLN
jgi:hypothetical protein